MRTGLESAGSDRIGGHGHGHGLGIPLCGQNKVQSRAEQSGPGPNNYNCIPSIPIDRCDSFDVVFGVFLVQDLALFCSLLLWPLCFLLLDLWIRARAKGTGDTL